MNNINEQLETGVNKGNKNHILLEKAAIGGSLVLHRVLQRLPISVYILIVS